MRSHLISHFRPKLPTACETFERAPSIARGFGAAAGREALAAALSALVEVQVAAPLTG